MPTINIGMARPKPPILLTRTDPKSFVARNVLAAAAIYAVYYRGNPINLLHNSLITDGQRYFRTSFCNPGHAFNLAERLNAYFRTDEFAVYRLTEGERISEGG